MAALNTQHLAHLAEQLVESLMTAAICAQEMRATLYAGLDSHCGVRKPDSCAAAPVHAPYQRPILDPSTLSVIWEGKSLHLGHTLGFRLLDHLSRHVNQYVTHLDLLREVWEDEEAADSTIRSVVRHLRRRLRDGDMGDLADGIRGHSGRYMLRL